MGSLWQNCFDYVFRYSFFAFLPPFTTPFKNHFKYLTFSFPLINFIRSILTVVIEGKNSFEAYFAVIILMQIACRTAIFILQEKSFIVLLRKIDRVLEVNNESRTNFKDVWERHKPERFIKYYALGQFTTIGIWFIQIIYRSFFAPEKVVDSPIPYYSPFFRWGGGYKLFNIIFDSMLAQTIYADIVTVTLLYFGDCLFFHLKVLLKEIKGSRERNYKIWIERHVQILNLVNDLKSIFQPHLFVQFLNTLCGTVFSVLSLLEEDGAQTLEQKISGLGYIFALLIMLGFECSIVERMLYKHGSMYETLVTSKLMYGKTKDSYFLKMLILRCQKPLRISAYGFFSMNISDFKELILHIYKLYSSLISLKSKRQH